MAVGLLYNKARAPKAPSSWHDLWDPAFKDHILLTDLLARSCLSCSIDAEPRKSERPSDHAPVVARVGN